MSCFLSVAVTSITGDCSNTSSGGFSIQVFGEAPGFAIQWVSPYTSIIPMLTDTYDFGGLSAGTYTFYVIDSCFSGNTQTSPVNVYISSGTCVNILNISNTTCNLPNGSLTVANSNYYGLGFFNLYEVSTGFLQQLTFPESISSQVTFTQLAPGTYYVISDDGAGCTGKSQSCIIKSSTTINFGLYVQNTTNCGVNTGSIYVTGLTGTPPFSYFWSNGQNGSSITGLTEGSYSVTIQDNTGCVQTLGAIVTNVPPPTITSLQTTTPSCFSSDGEVIAFVTGGTPPFYFEGSNGEVAITFASNYTFTGLSAGFFSVTVTDAGLCKNTASTSILTPNSFAVVSVSTTNSICNNSGGSLDVFLVGGSGNYTYSLTDSLGNTTSVNLTSTNYTFSNLSSGVYTLSVSNGGICNFSQNYTINNTTLFTLSASATGTTCNNSNGAVTLTITSGGTPPFIYQINGQSITTSLLNYTFSGLSSGNYLATVTDAFFCEQLVNFVVPSSNSVNFNLAGIGNSPGQSNGSLYAFITSGEPPFSFNWSNNIPSGQTGYTITGLSAGTYSLSISDDNGCVQNREITIYGLNVVSSYELFNVCSSELDFNGVLSKRGIQQYLLDGFFELTSGDTGCLLEETIFELETILTGTTKSQTFFTGTTIFDYPSDNEMYEVLQDLLLEFNGINNVFVDPLNNTLTIETICNPPIGLFDASVSISLKIYYKINCVSCS